MIVSTMEREYINPNCFKNTKKYSLVELKYLGKSMRNF